MKKVSTKQRRMNDANRDWRQAFVEEIGYCMVCSSRQSLCVHEMCCGAFRARSVPNRELCLVVCAFCNCNTLPGMKLAEQLCLKMLNDRWYFDLDCVREVKNNGRNPKVVDMQDIREAKERMGI